MSLDYDFDRAERQEKARKFIFKFLGWLITLGIVISLAWAISKYALEKTNMVGNSMEATLHSGDTVLINKLLYRFKEPERFDIIVYKKDGKEHSYYGIRRIIGLPGETVLIHNGDVYINGAKIEEYTPVEKIELAGLAEEEVVLEDGEYFVLGDNRNDSEDSRFANVGNVVYEEIVGKAWIRTNKFAIIGKLNMASQLKDSKEEVEDGEAEE